MLVLMTLLACRTVEENYSWFFDTHAAYESRVGQIDAQETLLAAAEEAPPPVDQQELARLRVELSGMRQSCRELVTSYNAQAAKVHKGVFQSNKLPVTLDPSRCE